MESNSKYEILIRKIKNQRAQVCVLGLGYIGLPTASMLATHGLGVLGVDVNQDVVEVLNQGEVHIQEPGDQQSTWDKRCFYHRGPHAHHP